MSIAEVNATEMPAGDEGIILHNISWTTYVKLRKSADNYNLRMTYDDGELEIMSPSRQHERIAALLGTFIEIWAMELSIPMQSCRTMTIRRKEIKRGFEPDNCYYVQNEPAVWNKKKLDFKTDPPPDLAIEVERSRSSLPKLPLYREFKVPELWRVVGQEVAIYELADGDYQPRATSNCFPNFPIPHVNAILKEYDAVRQTTLHRAFRDWVRTNCLPGD